MTEELIREIAVQIFNEQILQNWKFYLLILVLSFFGAFLASYLKKQGELQAVEENFSKILDQLKQNTNATEEIKTRINHSDWTQREWKTLRRIKLEELLTAIHQTMDWLEAERTLIKDTGEGSETPNPVKNAITMAQLYFPELVKDVDQFYGLTYEYLNNSLESLHGIYDANMSKDVAMFKSNYEANLSIYNSYNQKLFGVIGLLENKATDLMKTIMGV